MSGASIRLRINPSLIPTNAAASIGSVATLAPGSDATVVNVGTPQNPILDFGIPRGSPGIISSIVQGSGLIVDNGDPANPAVGLDAAATVRNYLSAPPYVATRTVLKTLDTTKDGIAYLNENGREGIFVWRSGNYATQVAADTLEGIYVKANSTSAGLGAWVRATSSGASLKWFGAAGDGATDDTSVLSTALSTASWLVISGATFRIGTNISIGAGKTLEFTNGGKLSIDSGILVSMNNQANIAAGRYQIVTGAGNFSNLRTVFPEWWGAVQSTTIDSLAAFQAAANSTRTQGKVKLNAGFYVCNGLLTITNGVHFEGDGETSTQVRNNLAAAQFALWTTATGGGVSYMTLQAKNTPPTSGAMINVTDAAAGKLVFRDLVIDGCYDGMDFVGASNVAIINGIELDNVHIYGAVNGSLLLKNVESVDVRHCFGDSQSAGAVSGHVRMIDHNQGVDFLECNFSNGDGPSLSITQTGGGAPVGGSTAQWNSFTNCNFDDANVGADINSSQQLRFINCWFSSNGRAIHSHAGPGIWLRSNAANIRFLGGVCSNNGERGIRVDAGAVDFFIQDMEIAGNNVNAGSFYNVDIFGNTTDFVINGCLIGANINSWTVGVPAGGVQIRNGTSDRYDVVYNRFVGLATQITDGGTGVDKDVTTGNRHR